MRKKLNGRVLAGLAILSVVLLVALLAPVLAPHDPYELGVPYLHPSAEHPLGTNDIGQDILSELIYGTRISLLIGVVSALAVTVVGTALGILSGYLGGWTDRIIMQVTNVAMALPSLPLTIILVAFLDASVWNIILAICITAWTSTARIIRSRVQQLKALPFIQIERTMGASGPYIMIRHILPNLGEIVFIRAVLSVGSAMLTEASLSFLGLGVIGQKSWGGILHYAFFRNGIINGSYWWYVPPILCISVSVLGFMLLSYYGEGCAGKEAERRKPMLEIEGVSIRFGDNPEAVSDTTFTVGDGDRLAVVGETGSGKSVLLLAALGLLPASARVTGSIRLNGRELLGCRERESTDPGERDRLYSAGKREWTQSTLYRGPPALRGHSKASALYPERSAGSGGRAVGVLWAGAWRGSVPQLSFSALRRYAPAGTDRHGDRRRGGSGSGG